MNHDRRLTLAYFTARSNLITYTFQWEKVNTLDFSGTFVTSDMKVNRYRHIIELMKLCKYSRSSPIFDLGRRSFAYLI